MAKYLTRAELAKLLEVSERKISDMASKGLIPYYKIGGCVRFVESEVDEHLKARSRVMSQREAQQRVYGRQAMEQ